MLTTTGFNFEGYRIVEYLDVISSEVVLGTGIFSSFSSSFADLTGTRSGSYERKLETGKTEAIQNLERQTREKGGNAIIGIDIDYTTFGADVLGVVATGTAVIIELDNVSNGNMISVPVLSYNTQLPFNICNIGFKLYNTIDVWCALQLKSYSDKGKVKALIADIELENIFEEKIVLKDVIFAISRNEFDSLYSTDFAKIDIENLRTDLLNKAYVSIKKVIFYGYTDVVNINNAAEYKNTEISSFDLRVLRKNYGEDVVCDKQINKGTWTCFCGATNDKNVSECYRCHRQLGRKYGSIDIPTSIDKATLNEIIDEVMTKQTANDIYEYILSLGIKELESLEYELKVLQKQEKVFDENKKDEAVDMIIRMLYQK